MNDTYQNRYSIVQTVSISDGVTSICQSAFLYCEQLTSVTIPNSVQSIGNRTFKGCDNLTIKGYTGSYAEQYAKENGIPFVSLDEPPLQTTTETTVTSETTTTAPQLLMGDFSGNGTCDMNDAVLLIRYITEDGSITAKTRKQLNPEAADLNGDGYLTMPDVRALLCLLNAG